MTFSIEYNSPNAKGVTKLQYLKQVGVEIEYPEPDIIGVYLLELFWEISAGRVQSGFGPSRLTWQDLSSWSNISGVILSSDELYVIRKLDAAYYNAAIERGKTNG